MPETSPLSERPPSLYDVIDYPGGWYPQTHPDRLATMGTLFGMQPAPPERCRVLEVGCGAGWNLLFMASNLPESEFVGIDQARRPIEQGGELATTLGLENVSLRALDLMDLPDTFGTFDYIVAHGVYSWVPAPVRDRLLAVCRAHLAPQGIAYVSYATYPGRYLTQMMREMMLHYSQQFEDPQEKVQKARLFLRFLRDAQPDDDLYGRLLDEAYERVSKVPDEYLAHDDLAEFNAAFYFQEFVGHAAEHGLQYVAEGNFYEMTDLRLSNEAARICRELARDHNDWEQYLDFLYFRRFRQTLLCHDDVTLVRAQEPEQMRTFYVAAPVSVEQATPSEDGEAEEVFRSHKAATQTTNPLIRAVFLCLRDRWPHFVAFDALVDEARARASEQDPSRQVNREDDVQKIGATVLKLYAARFLKLRVRRPPVFTVVSDRPVGYPIARLQVQEGQSSAGNVLSENVLLENPLERLLLPLLDGTRDRAALRTALVGMAEQGVFEVKQEGAAITDPQRIEQVIDEKLDDALERLAFQALLVA